MTAMPKEITTPHLHPSEMDFDLALVGAPSPAMQAHLATCASCQAQLQALSTAQELFAASSEPVRAAQFAASRLTMAKEEAPHSPSLGRGAPLCSAASPFQLRGRAARLGFALSTTSNLRSWVKWAFPVAGSAIAAACLLLLLLPSHPKDGIRLKGSLTPAIDVFVKRAAGAPERWSPSAILHENDAVQFGYHAAGFAHLAVFSLDGCDARLEYDGPATAEGLIPAGWQLKSPTGRERLYVAFAQNSISVAALTQALQRTPGGCDPGRAPDLDEETFVARGISLATQPR